MPNFASQEKVQKLEKSLVAEEESKLADKQAAEKQYTTQEEEHKAKVAKYEQQIKEIVSILWMSIS